MIGVVTGIQGTRRFRVEVFGEEAHAGTTPPARRQGRNGSGRTNAGAAVQQFVQSPLSRRRPFYRRDVEGFAQMYPE